MSPRIADKDYLKAQEMFSLDHDRLRTELLAKLDQTSIETPAPRHYGLFVKAALAVAATIAICLAALYNYNLQNSNDSDSSSTFAQLISPDAAWASALQQAAQVSSVHLIFTTPHNNEKGSSVEVWWQRPDCYRMKFDNGLILTGNGQSTAKYNPVTHELMFNQNTGPGIEVFILRELGQMFASEKAPMSDWIEEPKPATVEDVEYQGIACQKLTLVQDGQSYEYILDKATSIIYEGTRFSNGPQKRILSRMEVLSVDRQWPESLFTIEPAEGMKIVDHR